MYKPIRLLIRNWSEPERQRRRANELLRCATHIEGVRKFSTEKFFIRNAEFPICSNCLHFIEPTNTNPFDGNRCKKFGEMDLITGVIKYELAANCRLDDDMCGEEGDEYSAKK